MAIALVLVAWAIYPTDALNDQVITTDGVTAAACLIASDGMENALVRCGMDIRPTTISRENDVSATRV